MNSVTEITVRNYHVENFGHVNHDGCVHICTVVLLAIFGFTSRNSPVPDRCHTSQ